MDGRPVKVTAGCCFHSWALYPMSQDVKPPPHVFVLGVSSHHDETDESQPFLP